MIFFMTPVIGVTGKVDGPATGSALATIVHRLFMPREESRRASETGRLRSAADTPSQAVFGRFMFCAMTVKKSLFVGVFLTRGTNVW